MVMLLTKPTNSKMSFGNGTMSSFWQSYIEIIRILLDYLQSIGLGDWDLYQKASEYGFMRTSGKTMPNILVTVGQADSNSQTLIPIFIMSLSKGTSVSEDLAVSTSYFLPRS